MRSLRLAVLVSVPMIIGCGRSFEILDGDGGGSSGSGGSEGDATSSVDTTLTTTTAATDASATAATTAGSAEVTTDPTTDPTVDPTGLDTGGTTGATLGCCEPHGLAGCEDDAVAQCVCAAAPECCVFEWSSTCVEVATNSCGACGATDGGSSDGGTTGMPVGCDETVQIELAATDATLDGAWAITMSQLGEGEVAAIPMGQQGDGTVTWEVDIPCDDAWHIWVRGIDYGSEDSFYARLDGEPEPAPIFEIGCDFGGMGYSWRELNWRDPDNGGPCEYVEDPWVADWTTGLHQFQLEFRESIAVARIIVTNDAAFVPN